MEEILLKSKELVVLYGLNLGSALVIFVVGRWVALGIRALVRRLLKKGGVDETLVTFVSSLTYVAILAFIIIAALAKLGIQTTSFIAVLGAAGLAVGLALQGSLANFAAGILMILFQPFKVNDYVEGGGTAGTVVSINIFTTILKSPDNKKIIVPNAKMTGDIIVNYSANDQRRVDLVIGVSYSDDLDQVKKILEQILGEDERILTEPEPTIAVLELADSSINFAVRPWVKTSDYWGVYFDTQEKIKKRFDAENISIPFPQQDVHLFQTKTTV